jgi:hypothetical protein
MCHNTAMLLLLLLMVMTTRCVKAGRTLFAGWSC